MRQRSFGRPRAVARASDPVLSAAGSRGVFLEPLEAPRRSAAAECVALRPLATPERDRGPARGVLVSDHEVPPAVTPNAMIVTFCWNPSTWFPFSRKSTLHFRMPTAFGATVSVSLKIASVPLVTVLLAASYVAVRPESQVGTGFTVTGRFLSPVRIECATWSGDADGSTTPPVALAIAVACPVESSPLPELVMTGTAMTRMCAATSALIALARISTQRIRPAVRRTGTGGGVLATRGRWCLRGGRTGAGRVSRRGG